MRRPVAVTSAAAPVGCCRHLDSLPRAA